MTIAATVMSVVVHLKNAVMLDDPVNGRLRIGALQFKKDEGLLYGLFATQEKFYEQNFNEVRKSMNNAMLWLTFLGVVLLALIGFLYREIKEEQAISRKRNRQLKEENTELETAINRTQASDRLAVELVELLLLKGEEAMMHRIDSRGHSIWDHFKSNHANNQQLMQYLSLRRFSNFNGVATF